MQKQAGISILGVVDVTRLTIEVESMKEALVRYWYYLQFSCFIVVIAALIQGVTMIGTEAQPVTAWAVIRLAMVAFIIDPAILALGDEICAYIDERRHRPKM